MWLNLSHSRYAAPIFPNSSSTSVKYGHVFHSTFFKIAILIFFFFLLKQRSKPLEMNSRWERDGTNF